MPKVTVIMPAYNAERFLAAAVTSVLRQSWEDWELVVVDDGSTDATARILAQFVDDRVRVISQSNQGEGAARNAGLDAARGEYLGFLDADDLYLPNALADFAAYLDGHPDVGVVFADGYFCNEYDKPLMRLSEHRPGPYTGHILEPLILSASVVSFPVCTMTRRVTVERQRIRFDPSLVIGTDWDFWIQVARHALFGYLDRLTCMYRVHQTNITRRVGEGRRLRELAAGRTKVMRADWFSELSVATRREFFYQFLIVYLRNDTGSQAGIIRDPAFTGLPEPDRASLLRQLATDYLSRGVEQAFARSLLSDVVALCPGDRKSAVLVQLDDRWPPMCRALIRGWALAVRLRTRVQSIGRRHPRPAPAMLRPVGS